MTASVLLRIAGSTDRSTAVPCRVSTALPVSNSIVLPASAASSVRCNTAGDAVGGGAGGGASVDVPAVSVESATPMRSSIAKPPPSRCAMPRSTASRAATSGAVPVSFTREPVSE